MRVAAFLVAAVGVLVGAGSAPASFPFRPVADRYPQWSPDDSAIAYVSTEGPPAIFSLAAGTTTDIRVPSNTSFVSLSPDWEHAVGIVWGPEPTMVVFRPDGTDVQPLDQTFLRPWWSPNSRLLAYITREGDSGALYTIRVDGSERHRVAVATGGPSLAWSPDSRQLAFAQGGDLVLANADGSGTRRFAIAAGRVWSVPAWSPDGRHIVVLAGDSLLKIVLVSPTGASTLAIEPLTTTGLDTHVSWSPDSRRLLYSAENDAPPYGAVEVDVATGTQRRVAPFGRDASYSHDGTRIAVGGLTSVKDPPPTPLCVGVGIWLLPAAGGTPTRVTSRCNNPPYTVSLSAPLQLEFGQSGRISGALLPGFGAFVRGTAKPCGGRPSSLVTASVDGSWQRPIAPRVTTIYTASSDVETARATTIVRPRVTLQSIAKLRFAVTVHAAQSYAGTHVRVRVGDRTRSLVLAKATRRASEVTTRASFALASRDLRPWLEGLSAAVPARRCLAAAVSNELTVSR